MLVVYAGLIGLAGWQFAMAPTGFIPNQDQGYLITVIQLPPGPPWRATDASCARRPRSPETDVSPMSCRLPGSTVRPSPMRPMPRHLHPLLPFRERAARVSPRRGLPPICANASGAIQEAFIITIRRRRCAASAMRRFKMMVQDKRGRGLPALDAVTRKHRAAANQVPGLAGTFSLFTPARPKSMPISTRAQPRCWASPRPDVRDAAGYLGSSYVNDFNYLGRTIG